MLGAAGALSGTSVGRALAQGSGFEGVKTLHDASDVISKAAMFEGAIVVAEQLRQRGILTAETQGIGGGVPVHESPFVTRTYSYRNIELFSVEYSNSTSQQKVATKARLSHFDRNDGLRTIESWEVIEPPRLSSQIPEVHVRYLSVVLRDDVSLDCENYPKLERVWQVHIPSDPKFGNHGLLPTPPDYKEKFSSYRIQTVRTPNGGYMIDFVKKDNR